jgi:excisionase family DNA binding protein
MKPRVYFTVGELATILGWSRPRVMRWLKKSKISFAHTVKGSKILVAVSVLRLHCGEAFDPYVDAPIGE